MIIDKNSILGEDNINLKINYNLKVSPQISGQSLWIETGLRERFEVNSEGSGYRRGDLSTPFYLLFTPGKYGYYGKYFTGGLGNYFIHSQTNQITNIRKDSEENVYWGTEPPPTPISSVYIEGSSSGIGRKK